MREDGSAVERRKLNREKADASGSPTKVYSSCHWERALWNSLLNSPGVPSF